METIFHFIGKTNDWWKKCENTFSGKILKVSVWDPCDCFMFYGKICFGDFCWWIKHPIKLRGIIHTANIMLDN